MNSAAGASNVVVHSKERKSSKNTSKQPVDLEELVGTTEEKRNWRGIVIALLVIVTVLALIVTAIILVTPRSKNEKDGHKVSFHGFMKNEYEPRAFRPIWLPGEEKFLYRNIDGSVIEYDCAENKSTVIIDNSTFRTLNTDLFRFSADKKFVLFQYDLYHIYRHSTTSRYAIYEIETSEMTELTGPHKEDEEEFQYFAWSPKGHNLVCVQYNDIYYMNELPIIKYKQLTYDGYDNIELIYNGVPDWVYEEEILQSDNALWFSPDGTYLLYATFDDTEVRTYDMTYYGDMNNKYISTKPLRYPKPGTRNPKVKLKLVNLDTNETTDLEPPEEWRDTDRYFTTITWQNDNNVLISWLNRPQNVSIFSICNAKTSKCRTNYQVDAEGGWLDIFRSPIFTPSGDFYFILLPHKDGSAGSFQHIAKIDASDSTNNKQADGTRIFLTAGMWDVTEIVGYNDEGNVIYFIATKMGDPRMRHLYRTTTLKDNEDFKRVTCLSCDVSDDCQYVDASFTPTGKYYVLGCRGPAVPSYHLYSVANDSKITTLENNDDLRHKMDGMNIPVTEYFKIPISEDSTEYMWAKLLLPPILKKDEIITYNILFKVYGGPGSQMVTEEFNIGWEHYLCSSHDIIIAYVDGRGTSGRGNKWLHANYKQLGSVEVEDTITAATFFNNLHYVHERTAIWGLSYGGFLSASALAQGADAFKCGIAVSPVTDWRYYDSVYTERYMGLPTDYDNLGKYNAANVSRFASNFKKSRSKFFLIHGTGDDNVHFQNSAQLMKALTEEDVYFRSQIYTDETHFLNGGNTKIHLYNTMEEFIFQCFGKPTNMDNFDGNSENEDEESEE